MKLTFENDHTLLLPNVFACILGITSCAATIILYIVNREKKLIKATSRELSAFLLAGISLAFLTGTNLL